MKHNRFYIAGLFIAGITSMATLALADDDEFGERGEYEGRTSTYAKAQQPRIPVVNQGYQKECAACHLAYPASFLPSQSWSKIMNGLDHHFGENAELDIKTKTDITTYLTTHATERYVRNISKLTNEKDIPTRITETNYFKREHREVPARMVTGNPDVKSFSNCQSCHTAAIRGSFSEAGIRIPNYGGWD